MPLVGHDSAQANQVTLPLKGMPKSPHRLYFMKTGSNDSGGHLFQPTKAFSVKVLNQFKGDNHSEGPTIRPYATQQSHK